MAVASSLRQAMLDHLAASGLTVEDAKKLGVTPATQEQANQLVGQKRAGYVIPYFDVRGRKTSFFRLRFLEDPTGFQAQGDAPKYMQPGKTPPKVYFPNLITIGNWKEIVANPTEPLIITEGEKKAACATKFGFPTIGLGGVWSFRSKRLKEALIEDMRRIDWRERRVHIVYDSDAAENDQVLMAERELARVLTREGAIVTVVRIPMDPGGRKLGLDDYLVEHGEEALRQQITIASKTEQDDVTRMLWDLQSDVVFVKNPGVTVRVKNGQRMARNDFVNSIYGHWIVERIGPKGGVQEVSIPSRWMKWSHRRECDEFAFVPGKPRYTERRFNLWERWGCEPKPGSVKPFNDYMSRLFDGNKEIIEWVTSWLAYPVQFPGEKLQTALYIWGHEQGTGKSTLGYTMQPIYGPHWTELSSEQLESQFNGWVAATTFALVDDLVSGASIRKFRDILKPLITRKTITINEKYEKEFKIEDRVNYIFTANHPDSLRLDPSDRRFFVHEVTTPPWGREEATAYYDWLNGEGGPALFHHFLTLDLQGFRPNDRPPMTDAKRAVIDANRSDVERSIDQLVNDHAAHQMRGLADSDLFTSDQIASYLETAMGGSVSTRHVASTLAQHGGVYRVGPVRISDGRTRTFFALRNLDHWRRVKNNTRVRFPLREAAEHWEKHFGSIEG